MSIGPGLFEEHPVSHEFQAQHVLPFYENGPCVDVYFANSGLRTDLDLGAAPIVNLTRDYIRDGGGSFIGMNNRISLQGKIFPSGGGLSGISGVMLQEQKLRDLFKRSAGDILIKNDSNAIVFSGINAKVTSYSANNTPDNWSMSLDYNVELEFFEEMVESPIDNKHYRVSSVSENWSIEPQEMIYSSISRSITKQPETEPSQSADGSSNSQDISKQISISGIPQFRITRQLSAVGVPSSGFSNHIGKTADGSKLEYNYVNATSNQNNGTAVVNQDAYLNAKKWVEDRSELAFNQSVNNAGYSPFLTLNKNLAGFQDVHLYNHTKTVNFSVIDGSYETNDSWIAIPCGILFTEEYTIESSTDERFVSTVNIQGTVNGLSVPKFDEKMIKTTGIPMTGNSPRNKINLEGYNKEGLTGSPSDYGHYNTVSLKGNRYDNANSGFIKNVKPYLYERACMVLNSSDRTQNYNPTQGNIFNENPGNPAFRKQRRLNYIPVSTSEGHDPLKGIITYSYQYTNKTKVFSGVISESVDINVNGPGDVVAEAFVIGRPLGPILQNLNTRTSTTKSVNIEIVVVPPSTSQGFLLDNTACPVYTGSQLFAQVEDLVEGLKPYGDVRTSVFDSATAASQGNVFVKTNTFSWNPIEGRYARNVEWVYQPCQLNGDVDRYFLGR